MLDLQQCQQFMVNSNQISNKVGLKILQDSPALFLAHNDSVVFCIKILPVMASRFHNSPKLSYLYTSVDDTAYIDRKRYLGLIMTWLGLLDLLRYNSNYIHNCSFKKPILFKAFEELSKVLHTLVLTCCVCMIFNEDFIRNFITFINLQYLHDICFIDHYWHI